METIPQEVPEQLDSYCKLLDSAFTQTVQRRAFRTYPQGLLLGAERNKTATVIANTERRQDRQRTPRCPNVFTPQMDGAELLVWLVTSGVWLVGAIRMAATVLACVLSGRAASCLEGTA